MAKLRNPNLHTHTQKDLGKNEEKAKAMHF